MQQFEDRVPPRTKRIRRSPAEARNAVLAAARARLLAHGLEGLKIAAVARDAGMSHATLIHHFGSSLGMRDALIDSMAQDLLAEFVLLLDDGPAPSDRRAAMLGKLFATLSDEKHAQLFAWLAIESQQSAGEAQRHDSATAELLAMLLERIRRRDGQPPMDAKVARFGVVLAITSAMGLGLARPWLERMDLLDGEADAQRFAVWLGELLETRGQVMASERLSSSRSSRGSEQVSPEQ
jgi:AcrR family transcriptional regulator